MSDLTWTVQSNPSRACSISLVTFAEGGITLKPYPEHLSRHIQLPCCLISLLGSGDVVYPPKILLSLYVLLTLPRDWCTNNVRAGKVVVYKILWTTAIITTLFCIGSVPLASFWPCRRRIRSSLLWTFEVPGLNSAEKALSRCVAPSTSYAVPHRTSSYVI